MKHNMLAITALLMLMLSATAFAASSYTIGSYKTVVYEGQEDIALYSQIQSTGAFFGVSRTGLKQSIAVFQFPQEDIAHIPPTAAVDIVVTFDYDESYELAYRLQPFTNALDLRRATWSHLEQYLSTAPSLYSGYAGPGIQRPSLIGSAKESFLSSNGIIVRVPENFLNQIVSDIKENGYNPVAGVSLHLEVRCPANECMGIQAVDTSIVSPPTDDDFGQSCIIGPADNPREVVPDGSCAGTVQSNKCVNGRLIGDCHACGGCPQQPVEETTPAQVSTNQRDDEIEEDSDEEETPAQVSTNQRPTAYLRNPAQGSVLVIHEGSSIRINGNGEDSDGDIIGFETRVLSDGIGVPAGVVDIVLSDGIAKHPGTAASTFLFFENNPTLRFLREGAYEVRYRVKDDSADRATEWSAPVVFNVNVVSQPVSTRVDSDMGDEQGIGDNEELPSESIVQTLCKDPDGGRSLPEQSTVTLATTFAGGAIESIEKRDFCVRVRDGQPIGTARNWLMANTCSGTGCGLLEYYCNLDSMNEVIVAQSLTYQGAGDSRCFCNTGVWECENGPGTTIESVSACGMCGDGVLNFCDEQECSEIQGCTFEETGPLSGVCR